jgi:hypothetical protein
MLLPFLTKNHKPVMLGITFSERMRQWPLVAVEKGILKGGQC